MYECAVEARSQQEREQLILEHLPQVTWIASRIHEQLPRSVELDDLVSAGIVGLLAAVDNFDPRHNASLRTYAEYKIRGAILDSIRGLDGIPTHKRKRLKQIQQAIANAEHRLKRAPSEEEIAEELGIPLAEYGGEVSLLKFIGDDEAESPERILERTELERVIADGISKMPENERTVLSLYYKEEMNLREIAEAMGLHITRISQLRAQGILRLRAYMEHKWPSKRGIY